MTFSGCLMKKLALELARGALAKPFISLTWQQRDWNQPGWDGYSQLTILGPSLAANSTQNQPLVHIKVLLYTFNRYCQKLCNWNHNPYWSKEWPVTKIHMYEIMLPLFNFHLIVDSLPLVFTLCHTASQRRLAYFHYCIYYKDLTDTKNDGCGSSLGLICGFLRRALKMPSESGSKCETAVVSSGDYFAQLGVQLLVCIIEEDLAHSLIRWAYEFSWK